MVQMTSDGIRAAELFKSFVADHRKTTKGKHQVNVVMDEVHFFDNDAVVIGPLITTGLVRTNLAEEGKDFLSHTSVMFLVVKKATLKLSASMDFNPKQAVVVFDMLHYDETDRGILYEAAKAGLNQLNGTPQQEV